MREFDSIFLEFPLCALSFPTDEKVATIISYCILKNAKRVTYFNKKMLSKISEEWIPNDFDIDDTLACMILHSALELKIRINSISEVREQYDELHNYISNFEIKFGKDAFCRIGKELINQTKEGLFEYNKFSILCAISSVLGKHALYKRITKDRISYRMLGYKSLDIYKNLNKNEKLPTRRQIERLVNILHAKEFFGKFTYARRITYYSTKLNDDELRKAVFKSKVYWEEKKNASDDQEFSDMIKLHLSNLKKRKSSTGVQKCSTMVQ